MYTNIHIDIYAYIPIDAYLAFTHIGDVYINLLDMLDICIYRAGGTGRGGGGAIALFCIAKSKNGDKGKKERV